MKTTGFVYHPDFYGHFMGDDQPENASRIMEILAHLYTEGLTDVMTNISARLATDEQVALVHTPEMIQFIKNSTPRDNATLKRVEEDTWLNRVSYRTALRAVGAAITAVDSVMARRVDNAFVCARPPGHHAEPDHPMGFCIFNNAAIAAKYAVSEYGLKRVAVIDWDVHHGNGTETVLADDKRFLMCSIFEYPEYPPVVHRGGKNMINVPLPKGASTDALVRAVEDHWLPALHEFRPELIIISAGFDGHAEDDMAGLCLVESDYAYMTVELKKIAATYSRNRIVSILEGGYNVHSLARSVSAHIDALLE